MPNESSETKLLLAGFKFLQNQDYVAAFEALRPLAEQGNALAQYHVGKILLDGRAGKKDITAGRIFLEKAAIAGDVFAQRDLGIFFRRGETPDPKQALKWLEAAAKQGEPFSGAEISVLYKYGTGVPQDLKKAVQWLRFSAERGVPNAMQELALFLGGWTGVPKNLVDAYKWLALTGSDSAGLAQFAKEKGISQARIIAAQTRISKWQKKHTIPTGTQITYHATYAVQFINPPSLQKRTWETTLPLLPTGPFGFATYVVQAKSIRLHFFLRWKDFQADLSVQNPNIEAVFWIKGFYSSDGSDDSKFVTHFFRDWGQDSRVPSNF